MSTPLTGSLAGKRKSVGSQRNQIKMVSEQCLRAGVLSHVLAVFRQKFSEGRVFVFGSSAMNLCIPESDIDLTLHLPSRMKLLQELKVRKGPSKALR
ncbi:unnamed protein product, partial [Hapterophycus canaliculatus]